MKLIFRTKTAQVKQSKTKTKLNYPQRVAPEGVHCTLEMVMVEVKDVEVEMEVVVIQ